MNRDRLTFVAIKATTPVDHSLDDGDNNARACWGEAGIVAADPDWGGNETYISAKDAVTNICHAIRRMGMDPRELLDAGFGAYEQDCDPDEIGGAEPVEHDEAAYPNPTKEMPA